MQMEVTLKVRCKGIQTRLYFWTHPAAICCSSRPAWNEVVRRHCPSLASEWWHRRSHLPSALVPSALGGHEGRACVKPLTMKLAWKRQDTSRILACVMANRHPPPCHLSPETGVSCFSSCKETGRARGPGRMRYMPVWVWEGPALLLRFRQS